MRAVLFDLKWSLLHQKEKYNNNNHELYSIILYCNKIMNVYGQINNSEF